MLIFSLVVLVLTIFCGVAKWCYDAMADHD